MSAFSVKPFRRIKKTAESFAIFARVCMANVFLFLCKNKSIMQIDRGSVMLANIAV
jgi:hypothetical protein